MSKHIAGRGGYVAASEQPVRRPRHGRGHHGCRETSQFLGAHIIGAHAADLIHEAAMAMDVGASVTQMAKMIRAHPTMAEGLMEAPEDCQGKAMHRKGKTGS